MKAEAHVLFSAASFAAAKVARVAAFSAAEAVADAAAASAAEKLSWSIQGHRRFLLLRLALVAYEKKKSSSAR